MLYTENESRTLTTEPEQGRLKAATCGPGGIKGALKTVGPTAGANFLHHVILSPPSNTPHEVKKTEHSSTQMFFLSHHFIQVNSLGFAFIVVTL